MKKKYFSLVLLMCASISFAQTIDFNNGGGDFLWSNTANWSGGAVPIATNTVQLPLLDESLVDADFTIQKIQTSAATSGDVSVAGTNTLTIDRATGHWAWGIENKSSTGAKLSFKGKVNFNKSSSDFNDHNDIYIQGNASNSIEFAEGSLLTLTTGVRLNAAVTATGSIFYFNGSLAGSGSLFFGPRSISTFGSTSSNSAFTGEIVYFNSNVQVIVNTADDAVFYSGPKIQVNNIGGSITLNGANVFASTIVISGTRTFDFIANKNQSSMGDIILGTTSTLNLTIGDGVTNLSFGNTSASTWADGSTLNIINYSEGIVRFGTDNTGLTADQLSKIVVDGTGGAVTLNSEGYLVNASSLSLSEFEENSINPIAYPTLTSDRLYFNKPQKNVKIFNLNGKLLKHNTSANQSEIGVDFLSAGLYLIVFDNQIVEKFLKK